MHKSAEKCFGEYMFECRKRSGMDVRQAAKESGISVPFIYAIEAGRKGIPSLRTIFYLAKTYRVSLNEVIDRALELIIEEDKGFLWKKVKYSDSDVVRETEMIYGKYSELNKANRDMLVLYADFLTEVQSKRGGGE